MNFEELINGMPDDILEQMKRMAAKRMDDMVGTRIARRETRAAIGDDPTALKMFDQMCDKYDLNTQVVQALGNMKAMLEPFDANDFSSIKAEENLELLKHLSFVLGMSINSIGGKIKEIVGDDNAGNGNSSGPST